MSRVLAGVVINPDGSPASSVKITLVAKRTEAVSLLKGARFSFSTGADGSYSETVLDGFYSVLVERRGADIGLGDIVVETGDPVPIETLLALGNSVADPVDTALLQLVADAQQAAGEAQTTVSSLSQVDNTADISKPVSAPQLALINTKFASDQVGVAGGAASLDGSGFLHTSQLPPMAIGETFVVAAEADKLTLSAQTGDVAVVQGASNKTYRLTVNDPSIEANWVQLLFPSGNAATLEGNAGAYYLDWNNFQNVPTTFLPAAHGHTKSEVGLDRVDNTTDAEKPVSDLQQAAIGKRIDVAGLAACGLLTAHGLMKEPCAAKDFGFPVTVANQFTIKANRYRVGNSLIDVPDTVVTLPPAPDGTVTYDSSTGVSTQHADSADAFASLEKVVNGDFATDSNWVEAGSGWTISGGSATVVSTGSISRIIQTVATDIGAVYKVRYTISGAANLAAGDARNDFDGIITIADITTDGVFEYEVTAVSSSSDLVFRVTGVSEAGDTYSVENVSVTKVAEAVTLSRRDVVFLREDGSVNTFTGLDDSSDMATAGFAAVTGESDLWQDGTGFAVALAYTGRRNQGAYHEYFNEFGCRTWYDSSATQGNWYEAPFATGVLDTAQCMVIAFAGNAIIGARNSAGLIGGVSGSGRPGDKLYDAIYLSDITDPRAQATAPTPIQVDPDYWTAKASSGAHKNFVTEGIPRTIPKERGVVETGTTATTTGALKVGDFNNYASGNFVVFLNQNNVVVDSGFVIASLGDNSLLLTKTVAGIHGDVRSQHNRTNGDIYTILKEEYSESKGADNARTDIFCDPSNLPRQAFGITDHRSNEGSITAVAGIAIETVAGHLNGGVAGHVYGYIGGGFTADLAIVNYSTNVWIDFGTTAEFLANAKGMEGSLRLRDERGGSLIPDGTGKEFKMSRPVSAYYGREYSANKGASWVHDTAASPANADSSVAASWGADELLVYHYKTPAHVFTDSANLPVLGAKLGDVVASSHFNVGDGSALISNLIGKVPTKASGVRQGHKSLHSYSIDEQGMLTSGSGHEPIAHGSFTLTGGDSPAAKALPYLSDEAQPQLVVAAKELIYDDAMNLASELIQITPGNTTDDAITDSSYRTSNDVGGALAGRAWVCRRGFTADWDDARWFIGEDGNAYFAADPNGLFLVPWDGSGWGDDNTFNIVNNTSTATDNNKNTVLICTKSTKLPIRMPS